MECLRLWRVGAVGLVSLLLVVPSTIWGGQEPTTDELKARLANANVADRPPLCIRIAERQLGAADRLYIAGDAEQAKAALAEVVAYSELARDYAIQSRKHEKQSEIAIRKMARKLTDVKHAVSHDDQEQVQSAFDHLERIRDELLAAMFSKVGKK